MWRGSKTPLWPQEGPRQRCASYGEDVENAYNGEGGRKDYMPHDGGAGCLLCREVVPSVSWRSKVVWAQLLR
jgi:hypothetical protein